jgi:hypothetical protein
MKKTSKSPAALTIQQQISEIEEEIKNLKKQLLKPHFIKGNVQDYGIESQIIDKQNDIIMLYIKLTKQSKLGS